VFYPAGYISIKVPTNIIISEGGFLVKPPGLKSWQTIEPDLARR
jgi:hypothetical protein